MAPIEIDLDRSTVSGIYTYMTQIEQLIDLIFTHLQERGWDNPSPSSLSKSISIEAAELLEHFQWSEPDAVKIKSDSQRLTKVSEELADVLIYCLELAHILDLDVDQIIRSKIQKAAKKYPANLVKGDDNKYWELKNKHRQAGTD
jgi:dCTP diphosphatase